MGRGSTLVEKIIARAAGVDRVAPGQLVTAQVDLAFAHDSSGPRRWAPMLRELGVGLWDPQKVAIVSDHYVPAVDAESARILKQAREFAAEHQVGAFFDMVGICHLVLPEHGLIRPGAFVAGGDSHSPTAGAFGAYAAGYGATDMAAIVATGETWLAVPGRPVEDEVAALALASDRDAVYAAVHRFNAATLQPQIAAPHDPSRTQDVTEHAGIKVDQCYIGACVGAKIEDLRMAAAVLKGRKVSPDTRLLIAPASQKTTTTATQDGTLQTLMEAGAVLLPSGCGACAGYGAGVLADGEVCISSTNRNFKGRMGSKEAQVYLGSPYSVAAAAVEGRIADPRQFLGEAA